MEKDIQWIFTCSMQPLIFREWEKANWLGEIDDFNTVGNIYDEDYNLKDNINLTIEGSSHSKKHCSLNYISTGYALFFIKHKLWEIYKIFDNINVKVNAEYIKKDNLYYRYSDNGVCFIYNKNSKKYKLVNIGYQDFIYQTENFNKDRDVFKLYEAYVIFFCNKHNVIYEGI